MDINTQASEKLNEPDSTEDDKKLNERERMRHSKPRLKLSLIEVQVLLELAQGRSDKELDGIIKHYDVQGELCGSYTDIVKRLMKKFEAFTIAHLVYKAMKMGIIE